MSVPVPVPVAAATMGTSNVLPPAWAACYGNFTVGVGAETVDGGDWGRGGGRGAPWIGLQTEGWPGGPPAWQGLPTARRVLLLFSSCLAWTHLHHRKQDNKVPPSKGPPSYLHRLAGWRGPGGLRHTEERPPGRPPPGDCLTSDLAPPRATPSCSDQPNSAQHVLAHILAGHRPQTGRRMRLPVRPPPPPCGTPRACLQRKIDTHGARGAAQGAITDGPRSTEGAHGFHGQTG